MSQITLIQQNDIHGQLEPHWERFWPDTYRKAGGMARAATVIRHIRQQNPSVLVDCGDAIHGTLPAMRSKGQAIVPMLNQLGVEFFTPGNWEYGFGPEVLRARAAEMNAAVLACNLQDAVSGEGVFEPYQVLQLGGIRLGLIGLTSPIVPQMSPGYAEGLRFPQAHKVLPECIEVLRSQEQVELVILVSHMGFAQDLALARRVDGLDVILSGHTHNRLEYPAHVGSTLILQSGFSGSFLGRLDLEVIRGKIISHDHQLITLEESIEPDPELEQRVKETLEAFREEMDQVVGHTSTALHRMSLLETPSDNLITDAYRWFTQTEIAFSHGWRFGPPLPPGPITLGDLWTLIPTNPEVYKGKLRGRQIWNMLEHNLQQVLAGDPLEQAGGYFTRVSGLSVVFRPNNPYPNRIEHLQIGEQRVDLEREYTVTFAGERDVKGAEKQSTGLKAIEVVRRYLSAHGSVNPELNHRKFIAQ